MEIVLNFEKKELVVKQTANIKALYKRLKNLLGKDFENWTMVSDGTTWYYPFYPTYPWPYVTYGETGQPIYSDSTGTSLPQPDVNIYCLTDQVESTFKLEGKDLVNVLSRTDVIKET